MVCAYKGIKFVIGDPIKKSDDGQCLEPPLILKIIWVSSIEAFCDERTGDFQGSFYFFLFIFFLEDPLSNFGGLCSNSVGELASLFFLSRDMFLFSLDSKNTILGLTSAPPTSIPLPSYVRYLTSTTPISLHQPNKQTR